MELVSSNWQDIRKYYEGTFVKFAPFGDELFLIKSVSSDAIKGWYKMGKEEFILTLSDEAPFNLDFVLPHKSVYQLNDYAVVLHRVPARQYFRGICAENTKIFNPLTRDAVDINWKSLQAYVEKQAFKSLKEAINAKNYSSIALNSRMHYDRVHKRIGVDSTYVATYDQGQNRIHTLPSFKDEITALVAQDPFKVEVV